MNINEAATILRLSRDEVKIAISTGIELPISKKLRQLEAHKLGDEYDIDENKIDEFIAAFDAEDPGRHPPTAVCRELLVEANHRCAVCREPSPLDFHHIIEFSRVEHYDVTQMLAVCPTCHRRCGLGQVDRKAQRMYKQQLKALSRQGKNGLTSFRDEDGPLRFSWDDLKELITALHGTIISDDHSDGSKFDYSNIDLERKNELNNLGSDYLQIITDEHEPYFNQIFEFLKDPINKEIADLYYEIVDELRSKIAAHRDDFGRFEHVLVDFVDAATEGRLKGKRRVLNVLLSFMYVNCDIGRKA